MTMRRCQYCGKDMALRTGHHLQAASTGANI
jgi:hypothetical protein